MGISRNFPTCSAFPDACSLKYHHTVVSKTTEREKADDDEGWWDQRWWRGGRIILTREVGKAIKEWENHTKGWVSGSEGGIVSMPRSPAGCVIRGMQGGGSGGRIKAVWLLYSHLSQHDWSSEGAVKTAGTGPCWGAPPKPQSECLPTLLYFWKHPLCKQFAFKISARISIQSQTRRRDMSAMWGEPSMLSQLYHHTVINTEAVDVEVWTLVVCQ